MDREAVRAFVDGPIAQAGLQKESTSEMLGARPLGRLFVLCSEPRAAARRAALLLGAHSAPWMGTGCR